MQEQANNEIIKTPKRWRNQLLQATKEDAPKDYQIINFQDALNSGIAYILIHGPPGTPYEGYWLMLEYVGYQIPYKPPKITFKNIPWNPFVCPATGKICCDILGEEWSPALTMEKVLFSIMSLLSQNRLPSHEPGYNLQAAAQMRIKYSVFFEHAKQIVEQSNYKKQSIYKDEEKPPLFNPEDQKKDDGQFMEEKSKFINDPYIKKAFERKTKNFDKL